jgi:Cu+-exporting ATPase
MPRFLLACLPLAAAALGCATEIVEVPLAADHPAHPSAAPAPRPAASTTLRVDPQSPTPGSADQSAHDAHAAHGRSAETAPATQPAASGQAYVCPMHPEVTQATPGTCPKCNMKLVPKGDAKPSHEGHH